MKKIVLFFFAMLLTAPAFSQDIPSSVYGSKLPFTWEAPMPGGKMICTVHENGKMTSRMVTVCYSCGGIGACQVCGGTGGQYWYGMGIMPCGACSGRRACTACGGSGYSVMNTYTTDSGLTIGYDRHGNYYVAGPGESSSSDRYSRPQSGWYDCCSKVATFGITTYHRCKNCGKEHAIGTHTCKIE